MDGVQNLWWIFQEGGTSLYGERAKEKPFAARFASPDRHLLFHHSPSHLPQVHSPM